MNFGRRQAHRRLILLLAPIAFVLFGAAILDRGGMPVSTALPDFSNRGDVSEGAAASWGDRLWSKEDLFTGWPARLVAYPNRRFELKPLRPLEKPDVLLYWTPGSGSADSLPSDAHLLGRLGGTGIRRFILPDHGIGGPSGRGNGALILYSLGHQEVVT